MNGVGGPSMPRLTLYGSINGFEIAVEKIVNDRSQTAWTDARTQTYVCAVLSPLVASMSTQERNFQKPELYRCMVPLEAF